MALQMALTDFKRGPKHSKQKLLHLTEVLAEAPCFTCDKLENYGETPCRPEYCSKLTEWIQGDKI